MSLIRSNQFHMRRFILLISIFACLTCFGQHDDAISKARLIANELLEVYPGISIAVGIDNEIVWKEGFGWADAGKLIRVTPEHQFRMYSISKSITGIALSKLVEEQKLDINGSVREYIPELPDLYEPVKVRELINHTAGVRHYNKGEWLKISQDHCDQTDQAISTFINDPLLTAPGDTYKYTSFGYVLLSHLVSRVSGEEFNDFVKQEIFDRVGSETIAPDRSEGVTNEVKYFDKWNLKKAKWKDAIEVNNSCKFGGGGFVGTPEDVVKIQMAMLNSQIVSAETTELYYTGLKNAAGEDTGYAFGIGDAQGSSGLRYHSHTGSAVGANGVMLAYHDSKVVVVILGNLNDNTMNSRVGEIGALFLPQD